MTPDSESRETWPRGHGELAGLIRGYDWSETPLGPISTWSPILKTTVDTLLKSPVPIVLLCGSEGVMIYNDAYSVFAGARHPRILGARVLEGWPEVADFNRHVLDTGFRGETLTLRDQPLILHRHGRPEEVWLDLYYNPVVDEEDRPWGVLAIVVETTSRVVSTRRMAALRQLDARNASATTAEEACRLSAEAIGECRDEVPFSLLYLLSADGGKVTLAGRSGMAEGSACAEVDVASPPAHFPWPLEEALSGRQITLTDADGLPDGGPAVILPFVKAGDERAYGLAILGANPRRPFDDDYRGFFELLAASVARSITNARAFDEERRRARTLAEIDRAKTDFFSNVSHELRTPLTLLLAPVEEVLADPDEPLSPAQRERLELIGRNGRRLLRLVNNLLDFARLERGRLEARFEATELSHWTAELVSAFGSAVETAGLRLEVDCPPLGEDVHVDRDMWEKIVLNLVSNAFKFTFEGSIRVSLRLEGGDAILRVSDTGSGIRADHLPRIFERFQTFPGTRSRTREGSGIGLSLVRELARLHGGDVSVESELGRGSTFTVRIPRGSSHLPPEQIAGPRSPDPTAAHADAFVEEAGRWSPTPPRKEPESPPPLEPEGTILLADDNTDMREYVRTLLSGRWRVRAVADGKAALDEALREPPDLVVCDVMMPGLDGFELLRALRSHPSTTSVPVLMLSARAGEEARVEGLQEGADDYVVKPFSARELKARVASMLTLVRKRREAARLERLAREVAESEARRWQSLLEQAPAIICVVRGPQHQFEFANRRYRELFPTADYQDRPAREVHPELVGHRLFEAMDDALKTGLPYATDELPIRLPFLGEEQAEERFFNVAIQPIRDETGGVSGLLSHSVDVTEQVHARRRVEALADELRRHRESLETTVAERTAELRSAVEQLRQADRMKTEFLATISHELRTPLNAIIGFSDLLLDEPSAAQHHHELTLIRDSGRHLLSLIDDILEVSRLEGAAIRVERERFDAREVLQQLVDSFEPRAREKALQLELEICEPVSMWTDRRRLVQITSNLLDNAVKFTDQGRVVVGCVRAGDQAVITVTDTGIGVDSRHFDAIFESFRQVDSSHRRRYQGAGLGLHIARRLARLLGGDISISSLPGRGTTMTLRLPLEAPEIP